MKRAEMNAKRFLSVVAVVFGSAVVAVAVQAPMSMAQADELRGAGNTARVQLVADRRDSSEPENSGYNPDQAYPGGHDPKRLYKVVLGPQTWRANLKPERVRDVSCREAKLALEQNGTWFGRITQSGDCSMGDPTDWATGNYLNFLEQPREHAAEL